MMFHELERYMEVFNKLKDDHKKVPDARVTKIIFLYLMEPEKERTQDDGISYLIANAIRKHRNIPYPYIR